MKISDLVTEGVLAPDQVDAQSVREELARIAGSDAFRQADRQRELLSFIVEAALRGDQNALAGKNIAQDFFGIDAASTQEVSTVRVEAGRLRRRLHRYYQEEGAGNPVHIDIPKGAYVPSFEFAEKKHRYAFVQRYEPWKRRAFASLAGILCLGLVVGYIATNGRSVTAKQEPAGIQPAALSERETMFLEAFKIARPPSVRARVQAAINLSRELQTAHPEFGGGYAAEAIQLWNWVMMNHSQTPDLDIERALELTRISTQTDPEYSWGYHALAQAFHLSGDPPQAIDAIDRAIDLAPNRSQHLAVKGMVLAVTGHGEESVALLEKANRLAADKMRGGHGNVLGVAYFHAGRFDDSAEIIQRNRDSGGPFGPYMLIYLAAAHGLAGNVGRGEAAARLLELDESSFSPTNFIARQVSDQAQRDILFEGLSAAGYTALK